MPDVYLCVPNDVLEVLDESDSQIILVLALVSGMLSINTSKDACLSERQAVVWLTWRQWIILGEYRTFIVIRRALWTAIEGDTDAR